MMQVGNKSRFEKAERQISSKFAEVNTIKQTILSTAGIQVPAFNIAIMAAIDASKPIAFCEHLQLSSLGVQPASISFQVR